MNKELNQKKIVIRNNFELALTVGVTSIVILAGTWVVVKISREILKELDGMGL